MNRALRYIFYNEREANIRAGWRMGIFAVVLAAVTALFSASARLATANTDALPGFLVGGAVLCAALFCSTWIVAKFVERRPPFSSVGFSLNGIVLRELGQGSLIGGGMMGIIFLVEYSLGMVTLTFKPLMFFHAVQILGASVVIFAVGATGEELLFRGYLFQTLVEGVGRIAAVVIFALLFAVAHRRNPNVTTFSLINVGLAGVWLSIAYFKTRTLWFPIAIHFSWNFFQNHVFSFPVSGIQFSKFQLGTLAQSGPSWLTGGTFGPEGGALTTLMLAGSAAFIYFSDWVRVSDKVWTLEKWKAARSVADSGMPLPDAEERRE